MGEWHHKPKKESHKTCIKQIDSILQCVYSQSAHMVLKCGCNISQATTCGWQCTWLFLQCFKKGHQAVCYQNVCVSITNRRVAGLKHQKRLSCCQHVTLSELASIIISKTGFNSGLNTSSRIVRVRSNWIKLWEMIKQETTTF